MGKTGSALPLAEGRSQIEAAIPPKRQGQGIQASPAKTLYPKQDIGKPDLFQYLEYRSFLADYVEWRLQNNPRFSKRAFSLKYFGSSGILYAVMLGQRDFGPKMRVRCAAALSLDEKENGYFELLVQHNQAKTDLERNFLFEKLSRFRNSKPWVVRENQHKYYAKWYYAVVFSYIGLDRKKSTPKEIAGEIFPALSEGQVREAIDILVELELVRKSDRGYVLTRNHVISGGFQGDVALEYNRQIQGLVSDMAEADITRFREFSTQVTSISSESLQAIRRKFSAFQEEVQEIISKDKATDKVCTMVFQIMPNTR